MKNKMVPLIVVVLGVFVVMFVFVISSEQRGSGDLEEVRDPSTQPSDGFGRDDTPLTETSCTESSGTWNSCGSACRTDPDAICIELCVEYCECQEDSQCPSGYTCGDFVDDVGVCL
ncbi:hypothetical protein HY626_03015 [Candidatus Uhrbacteria bacterium]|nr:hypothetical protein [Candidatus Uhrbacteria bacterium]